MKKILIMATTVFTLAACNNGTDNTTVTVDTSNVGNAAGSNMSSGMDSGTQSPMADSTGGTGTTPGASGSSSGSSNSGSGVQRPGDTSSIRN